MKSTAPPPMTSDRPTFAAPEPRSVPAAAPPQARPAVQGFSPFEFLRQHALWSLFAFVIAGAAAWYVGENFARLSYIFEAQLLYNCNEAGSPDYQAPSLHTLVTLAESRGILEDCREELSLQTDLETLSHALEVEVPYESNLMQLRLTWDDELLGAEILRLLVDRFVAEVATARIATVQRIHMQYESTLSKLESRLANIRDALQQFNREADVVDLERDLMNLRLELQLLDSNLSAAVRRKDGYEAQLEALTVSGSDSSGEMSAEAKSAARRTWDIERWRVLRDLVDTEKQKLQLKTQLEFKRREFERARQLHEKQLISDVEFEKTASELRSLEIASDPSLQGLRTELESIESRVPSVISNNALGSSLLSSGLSPVTQIELSLIENEEEIKHLERQIAQKKERLGSLTERRQEGQSLSDSLRLVTAERDRVENRLTNFAGLLDPGMAEFAIVQPPAPAISPVKSNQRKLMLGTFVACVAVLLGPLLLRSMIVAQRETPHTPHVEMHNGHARHEPAGMTVAS